MSVAQSCPTLCDPMDGSQVPLSMDFSRQEYWSGLPLNLPANARDTGSITWKRKWQSAPVFLPGKFYGQKNPGGLYSSQCCRVGHDSASEHTHIHTHTHTHTPYTHYQPRRSTIKFFLLGKAIKPAILWIS